MLFMLTFITTWANAPKSVIIFDASGSMWGQVDGKAKISIAKEALQDVLKKWNPEVELGLTVYGHRTKGDCADIETVVPVGKIDKKNILNIVKNIQPKGKTPISTSLEKVAKEMKFFEEKATIILISDGKESCDADPCATAKELEKQGIDFVAHVIGFYVDKNTDAQLECIANATGGEYFSAKDATALNDAMNSIVKKVEEPKPKPTIKKPTILKDNLQVTTFLSVKQKTSSSSITVYQEETDEYGKKTLREIQSHNHTNKAIFTLPEGNYTIKAYKKHVSVEKNISIRPEEKKEVKLIFDAGTINVTTLSANKKKFSSKFIGIYKEISDEYGKIALHKVGQHLHSSTATFIVEPGDYVLKANEGKVDSEKKITLRAGEILDIDLVYANAGKLKAYAVLAEGGEPIKSTKINIYTEFTDEFGKASLERVTWKPYRTTATFDLPAGKYVAEAGTGSTWVKVPVTIEAGKDIEVPVVLNAGKIKAYAVKSAGGKAIVSKSITVYKEVKDEYGKPSLEKITWTPYPKTTEFILPVGKYVVEAIGSDGLSGTKGSKKVIVKAGQGVEAVLVLEKKPTKEEHIKADTLSKEANDTKDQK